MGTTTITVVATVSLNGGRRLTSVTQTFTVTVRPAFDLDVDGRGGTTIADGIMIIRYIAGTTEGDDLTAELSRTGPADVARNIAGLLIP